MKFRNYLATASEVLGDLRLLGYEEVEGLSDPGHVIPDVARFSTRYGKGHVPYPYVI